MPMSAITCSRCQLPIAAGEYTEMRGLHVSHRPDRCVQLLREKHVLLVTLRDRMLMDTAHGCSLCADTPVINVGNSGTYWLCGGCVGERLDEWSRAREVLEAALEVAGYQPFDDEPEGASVVQISATLVLQILGRAPRAG
jgi:hypothetical protein